MAFVMASFQVREVIVYIYTYIYIQLYIYIYIVYSDSLSHGNFTYTIGDSPSLFVGDLQRLNWVLQCASLGGSLRNFPSTHVMIGWSLW